MSSAARSPKDPCPAASIGAGDATLSSFSLVTGPFSILADGGGPPATPVADPPSFATVSGPRGRTPSGSAGVVADRFPVAPAGGSWGGKSGTGGSLTRARPPS
jgi:hypothetical protein